LSDPYQVVRDFEAELCRYTGSRFAVTMTSCTMALLLACFWDAKCRASEFDGLRINIEVIRRILEFEIPRRTYVSVPMSIIHAGGKVAFRDEEWSGAYQLKSSPVWDSARRFTSGMYVAGQFQCLSFHPSKILGLSGHGGAILHNDPEADEWLRKARYDGRTEGLAPKDDKFTMFGWHCYMAPETAAQGLVRLKLLPDHNDDLPNSDYPDLSKMEIFQ